MGPTSNSVSSAKPTAAAANPFMLGSSNIATNPFAAQQRPSPSLHEMMTAQRSASVNNDSNGTQHPVNLPVHPQIPLLCRYFNWILGILNHYLSHQPGLKLQLSRLMTEYNNLSPLKSL
uniref:Uncharacterized protein n=1 Tax=Ditylenchus dipsaci TaxID=166011 RepID=A0A915E0B3_9BILA